MSLLHKIFTTTQFFYIYHFWVNWPSKRPPFTAMGWLVTKIKNSVLNYVNIMFLNQRVRTYNIPVSMICLFCRREEELLPDLTDSMICCLCRREEELLPDLTNSIIWCLCRREEELLPDLTADLHQIFKD